MLRVDAGTLASGVLTGAANVMANHPRSGHQPSYLSPRGTVPQEAELARASGTLVSGRTSKEVDTGAPTVPRRSVLRDAPTKCERAVVIEPRVDHAPVADAGIDEPRPSDAGRYSLVFERRRAERRHAR